MDNRRYNELIVFLIRKTGWHIDYVCHLPLPILTTIARELRYQHDNELFQLGSYSAMTAAMMARKGTRITDLIGNPPRRAAESAEYNLAKENEVETIKLKDDKEYTLSPLNLNLLSDIEDKFDKPYVELVVSNRIKYIRYILFARLRANYPELTEERVGELMEMEDFIREAKKIRAG